MEKNKTGKYLKYAFGEIILVVLGILIALWINSAYQDMKNEKLATIYLTDFKRDLVADTTILAVKIGGNENIVQHVDSILFTLANRDQLSDIELKTFVSHHSVIMRESYFIPEKSTIRQLEASNNAALIPSKVLKDKLFQYHTTNDRNEKNMEVSVQLYMHSFITRDFVDAVISGDLLKQNFGSSFNRPNMDLNELRSNDDYISSLVTKRGISNNQNESYKEVKKLAQDLIDLIDAELEK